MAQPPPAPMMQRGIVKQVLSGDNVLIRGQPKGGPPPERQLALSNVVAPRLARRAVGDAAETVDEPYAWECREYLRKKIIGKDVQFSVEYKVPGSGKEYGSIFVKNAATGELDNVTEELVSLGLVQVRRGGIKPSDDQNKLNELEDAAKSAGKGRWSTDTKDHVREITWNIENPRLFVDQKKGKPLDAVIEMVRDGSTVRAFLLPDFDYVTVMLTGIKCPMVKRELDQEIPEPYSAEAKYFTDSRLLQRDIQIILEGVSNNNFLGSVVHPAGNIAELLLKEGFANCVDWSMGVLTSGHDTYRQSERSAKEKQLRIWKDYVPSTSALDIKDKEFNGKVVEVINSDAVVVKVSTGETKKVFMSSLRPPRAQPKDDGVVENGPSRDGKRGRPLYDIPYMFEAREFLRKKLIGKRVHVLVDYVKAASDGYPERMCATVTIADINVAEALISKGLATALRHRQDDDQRSSCYDVLLSAESRAAKNGKGLHSKKESPTHRIADLSGDVSKSRQFFPFLQRAGRSNAIVEFVASGSRFRMFLPKETCLLTFLLAGISCPRMQTFNPAGNQIAEDEPMGTEAYQVSKDMILQHEVEVQVDNIDKGGNFIGWLFVGNVNLSLALVEQGLSKVHFTAERSSYYSQLTQAEENARSKKIGIWKDYVPEVQETAVVEETERKQDLKKIVVTEVIQGAEFWAQHIDNATAFEQMQQQLRNELTENPPLPGSLTPRKGDLVASLFVDNLWYRARVEKVASLEKVYVLYVDYGNREVVSAVRLAQLPPKYASFLTQARQYSLACLKLPEEDESLDDLSNAFAKEALNKEYSMNIEYKLNGQDFVTLTTNAETKTDLAYTLLSYGVVMVERRREKRLEKVISDYCAAQDIARKSRLNLWRYGDFTADNAPEFGAI